MFSMLFWIGVIATAAMAFRSRQLWQAYHRADVGRVPLVNQIVATLAIGAGTVVVAVLKGAGG